MVPSHKYPTKSSGFFFGLPTKLGSHPDPLRVDRRWKQVSGSLLNWRAAAFQRSVVFHMTSPTFVGSLIVLQIMHHVALAAVPLAKILLISVARNVQDECDLGEDIRPSEKTWNNPSV